MTRTDFSSRLTVLLADAASDEARPSVRDQVRERRAGGRDVDLAGDWAAIVDGLLAPQGVRTVRVRSGREALGLIEQGGVHVAVLDQRMPQLSGLQIVRLMQEMRTAPPTILVAEDPSTHLLHEALAHRVFSVLAKPVQLELLLDALARALRRHYQNKWPGERPTSEG